MNKIFVFGSFSEGMPHFQKIESFILSRRAATVRGALLRLPSGLAVLVNDGTQTISGEILELNESESLLARLDLFHGLAATDDEGLFYRAEVLAITEIDSQTESVFAYAVHPRKVPRGTQAIDGADWRRSLSERPPLFSKLSERQRTYIQKLGGCGARDLVPIDLTLYRELLHLEIVVDKGRRLALTPLGHELYRMLN